MHIDWIAGAMLLLSAERLFYYWAWRHPDSFRDFCSSPAVARLGEPSTVVETFFYGFKLVQLGVFGAWCWIYGEGSPIPERVMAFPVAFGLVIAGIGQILNFSVFLRLGRIGVFYGNRFGYDLPHVEGFPFSLFKHPQYIGAVLSIWGFFMITRFPHDDWIVLPLIETLYYTLGAYFESE